MFPFGIWGAKISKAQRGLSQVFPIFPVRSSQWLTGVSNVPLLLGREGDEMSELVTYSYFELLWVHRSIIWKGVCCWEKSSPFWASAEALMSSKTTESIWNVWCWWGSFWGEAEETPLRSVYTSACPIPTAVFWNFEQIISRMSLKIKFVFKFLHAGGIPC